MKQIIITSFALLCFFCKQSFAQDLVFSQYYNASLTLNPAFAGNTDYPHLNLNYRNQWPSFDNTFLSYMASYDQYFHNAKSGIGLMLLSDNLGDGILLNNSVSLNYSYKIEFNRDWQLKIGLSSSLGQTRIDWTKLIFEDQIDRLDGYIPGVNSVEIPSANPNNIYFNVNTGVLLYNNTWYAGVSFFNLNSPYQGFFEDSNVNRIGLPIRYSLHGGYQFVLEEENKNRYGTFISPNLLVTAQTNYVQITPGVAVQYQRILGGLWYRHAFTNPDALIFSAGFLFDIFKVTYSYDLTISKLSSNTGGSHELSMVFNLTNLAPERSKLNDCLKLFR